MSLSSTPYLPLRRPATGWVYRSRRALLKNMVAHFSIKPRLIAVRPLALSCRAWRKMKMKSRPKILLIEDDASIVGGLKKELQAEGYEVTVATSGDNGLARAIYQHSSRAAQPFIAVNCAAIPETLLESELFGHERGAFTGAHARRVGRFEQANHGTIFLDEIGDLSLSTQVKLLRVLQEKYVQRVGGNEKIPVDVRALAATHRDLETALKENQFREDLFYRLSGVTIALPPLSQRPEDIPDLVKYFMRRSGGEVGVDAPSIQPEAIVFLQNQAWRGNVRELENVVRQALLIARNYPISLEYAQEAYARTRKSVLVPDQTIAGYFTGLLAKAERGEADGVHAKMIEEMERELFARAIQLAQGNQAKAARWLGVTRTTMREKLMHFGLHPAGEKQDE